MKNHEASAAKALLAHFNRELAATLVRRILKEKSQDAWKKLTDQILLLVPKAAESQTWNQVSQFVAAQSEIYIRSEPFKAIVDKTIKQRATAWAEEAVNRQLEVKAREYVAACFRSVEMSMYVKSISGRFQLEVEKELTRRAKEAADNLKG